MKKVITIIAICAACLTLTACNTKSESANTVSGNQNPDMFSALELTRCGMGDKIIFEDLQSLEEFSHIAVVGKFIGDTEQDVEYEYNATVKKDVITEITSTNTIKVSKVLMGDGVAVGDELKIDQRYGIVDGKLLTFSDLTPMQKGDEWIFFLRKRHESDHYICAADNDSRFPTKNSASKNSRMALAASPELGVYDEADFNQNIYNEVIAKYDV